jgi:hypothetical protein
MGEREVYTGLSWGNPRERNHLEDSGIDERIMLRWIFRAWIGSIRLRIGASGGIL